MKDAIDITNNDVLRIRYNSAFDTHAGDLMHRLACMVNNTGRVLFREDKRTEIDHDLMIRYVVEEEPVSSVEMGLNNGSVYEMKDIYEACIYCNYTRTRE